MNNYLRHCCIVLFIFCFISSSRAQSNQAVINGTKTLPINFSGSVCDYNWTNNLPGIGLAANGAGNIAAFVAANTGTIPITATITATSSGSGFAYIADVYLNIVSVVNTSNNTIVAKIPVGLSPQGVSVSPDGSRVYISNYHSNTVSVINALNNTVIATVPLNGVPGGICVSPDGQRIYVSNLTGSLDVIDAATNTVISSLAVNTTAYSLTVSPDGSKVYLVGNYSTDVLVIDAYTNTIASKIPIGFGTNSVCLSPDGKIMYVTTRGQTVLLINTLTNAIVNSIPVSYPGAICINPDGGHIYLSSEGNKILVINTATRNIEATIPAGPAIEGVSITPDGSKVYVANQITSSVSVISTATNTTTSRFNVGSNPYSYGNFVSGCSTKPITFTITINPSPPVLVVSGVLSAIHTTYGTPSESTRFMVSGQHLKAAVSINAPLGFEVSTDDLNFSANTTLGGTETLVPTFLFIRLSAKTFAGNYSGGVGLKSLSAESITLPVPESTVSPAILNVKADDKSKIFGSVNPDLTVSYSGFMNGETSASLQIAPLVTTIVDVTSLPGQYVITPFGGVSYNYSLIYTDGKFDVLLNPPVSFIPNSFSPNGDGIHDTWKIHGLDLNSECTVVIINRYGAIVYSSTGYAVPWDGTQNGSFLPLGTYYYVINLKNNNKRLAGSVTIIR